MACFLFVETNYVMEPFNIRYSFLPVGFAHVVTVLSTEDSYFVCVSVKSKLAYRKHVLVRKSPQAS